MIIDEAHNIKNHKAKRTVAMKEIKADCRFAMTGMFCSSAKCHGNQSANRDLDTKQIQ